jgi:hypothetical protein
MTKDLALLVGADQKLALHRRLPRRRSTPTCKKAMSAA